MALRAFWIGNSKYIRRRVWLGIFGNIDGRSANIGLVQSLPSLGPGVQCLCSWGEELRQILVATQKEMSRWEIFGLIAGTNIGWVHSQETANGTGSQKSCLCGWGAELRRPPAALPNAAGRTNSAVCHQRVTWRWRPVIFFNLGSFHLPGPIEPTPVRTKVNSP